MTRQANIFRMIVLAAFIVALALIVATGVIGQGPLGTGVIHGLPLGTGIVHQ